MDTGGDLGHFDNVLKEDYHIINKLIIQLFCNYFLNFYTFLLCKKHTCFMFILCFEDVYVYGFFLNGKQDKICFFAVFKLGFHPPSSVDFHRCGISL